MTKVETIQPTFTREQIAERVAELGAAIRQEAGDSSVFLIGILKGTAVFLSDLMRAIPGEVCYSFIDKVQDVSDTTAADAVEIDFFSHFDVKSKNVYLLKDVVSTGSIENYLLTHIRTKEPATLRLVALLDRPALRTNALNVDHSAFKVGEGTFVGYGLDFQNRHANLTYIGLVRE